MDYLSPIVVYTHKNTVIASSLPVSSSFAIVSLVYVYENSSFHLIQEQLTSKLTTLLFRLSLFPRFMNHFHIKMGLLISFH